MILDLFWKDINDNSYFLGTLFKNNEKYYFEIDYDGLKQATKHGCFGIGEIKLYEKNHVSDTLFNFFKRRIPSEENIHIEEILNYYDMKKYDEMELLAKTNGQLDTDRYYLKIKEE